MGLLRPIKVRTPRPALRAATSWDGVEEGKVALSALGPALMC